MWSSDYQRSSLSDGSRWICCYFMKTLDSNTTKRIMPLYKKKFSTYGALLGWNALLFLRRKQCGYMEIYASKEYQRVCIIQKKLMRVLLSDLKKSLERWRRKTPLFSNACYFFAESPWRVLIALFSMPNRLKLQRVYYYLFPQRRLLFNGWHTNCEKLQIYRRLHSTVRTGTISPQVSLFVLWFVLLPPMSMWTLDNGEKSWWGFISH